MYENYTFDYILNRMISKVKTENPGLDTREGSVIYNALAPAAVELAKMYIECDVILNESFADTASREYLIKRVKEYGITPIPAKSAIMKGVFNIDIPLNSRFKLDELVYYASLKISNGIYQMTCETAGVEGHRHLGSLIPIDYIDGLETAEITEIIVNGEDEEDTEVLRTRYFSKMEGEAFGGNKKDYIDKVNTIQGVGGCKVYPAWNGGGTVKIVFIDNTFNKPSTNTVSFVQNEIDPTGYSGQGFGVAPIGHQVTVAGVDETTVNVDFTFQYQSGYNWAAIQSQINNMINDYFTELKENWPKLSNIVVRVSQLEVRAMEIPGVVDVPSILINSVAANLVLTPDSVPKVGVISGN